MDQKADYVSFAFLYWPPAEAADNKRSMNSFNLVASAE